MNFLATKKMTYAVNTVILLLVLGLMAFFRMLDATFLIIFSIPTIVVYLMGYVLIWKEHLAVYVWMVYVWLTLYMGITTIFLGYGYGFHLYCFSMIPVMFVTEYVSYRLERRSLRALAVSLMIALFYLLCTGYVAYFGPIYEREQKYAAFFWIFNALLVFGFLIFYTNYMLRLVIESEQKLREMAEVDRLTKLYNRHYVINRLRALPAEEEAFLAMVDIDKFKKINDQYGHNAGDEVLRVVSKRMRECCEGMELSRWGGEEFLILAAPAKKDQEKAITAKAPEDREARVAMMERLRQRIEEEPVTYEGNQIPVTITIGTAFRGKGQSVDAWIQAADKNLYLGKNNGRNKVVS